MAFVGIAALAEGTVTAATVLSAVAEIGTVMSVVGAVTGNKDLMKIGGVMGLVGGIGGLAAGGLGAAAAPTIEETTNAIASAAPTATDAADFAAMDFVSPTEAASNAASNAATSTAASTAGTATNAAASNLSPSVTQTIPDQTVATVAAPSAPDVTAGAPAAPTVTSPTGPAGAQAPTGPTGAQAPTTPATTLNKNAPVKATDLFGKISGFMDNNKQLTNTLTTFGLGALKGIGTSQFQQTQSDILKQQAGNAKSVVSTGASSVYNPTVSQSIFNRARTA